MSSTRDAVIAGFLAANGWGHGERRRLALALAFVVSHNRPGQHRLHPLDREVERRLPVVQPRVVRAVLAVAHDHVLVRERETELRVLDRAEYGLNLRHGRAPFVAAADAARHPTARGRAAPTSCGMEAARAPPRPCAPRR